MKCPNCGSENVNLISNTTNRGFKGSDACCGYILMGPLGILCGSFGSGKKNTSEFWVCNSCGSRFQDKQIKKYNQNLNSNSTNIPAPAIENTAPKAVETTAEVVAPLPKKEEIPVKSAKTYAPKTVVEKASPYNGNLSADALLKRALIFLEDGDWEKAYEYSENALDVDAGYAEAYLAKFMAEYNIFPEDSIPDKCADMMSDIESLSNFESYRKAQRFGDDEFKQKLENYSNQAIYLLAKRIIAKSDSPEKYKEAKAVYERISGYSDAAEKATECEKKYNDKIYSRAANLMNSAGSENGFLEAKSEFEKLGNYKDSAEKAEECFKSAEEYRKKYIYNQAAAHQQNDTMHDLESAILKYNQILDYKDSAEQVNKCKARIEELSLRMEEKRIEMEQKQQEEDAKQAELMKKRIKICAIVFLTVLIVVIFIVFIVNAVSNNKEKSDTDNYNIEVFENGSNNVADSVDDLVFSETKEFMFDDGYLNVTSNTYYYLDSDSVYNQYTNFVPVLHLNKYPNSEDSIISELEQFSSEPVADGDVVFIGKIPSLSENDAMYTHIYNVETVYNENNYLFVTISSYIDEGSSSLLLEKTYETFLFDLTSGKRLSISDISKYFDAVKGIVYSYTSDYLYDELDYDYIYDLEYNLDGEYTRTLLEYDWNKNNSWTYDGNYFTVYYYHIFNQNVVEIKIPANEIITMLYGLGNAQSKTLQYFNYNLRNESITETYYYNDESQAKFDPNYEILSAFFNTGGFYKECFRDGWNYNPYNCEQKSIPIVSSDYIQYFYSTGFSYNSFCNYLNKHFTSQCIEDLGLLEPSPFRRCINIGGELYVLAIDGIGSNPVFDRIVISICSRDVDDNIVIEAEIINRDGDEEWSDYETYYMVKEDGFYKFETFDYWE